MDILENAAEVYLTMGEIDRAFQALEELLKQPSPLSSEVLKLNRVWDPTRQNPRFERSLPKFSANT